MRKDIIRCPYCGAEYLPEELFVGDEFLGNSITCKNEKGKIEVETGEEPELETSYICDFCDKKFYVNACITFTTKKDDFDEEYVVKIK